MGWFLLGFCVLSSAGASVFLKLGSSSFLQVPDLKALIMNPMLWTGGVCYGAAFFGYIYTLRLVPLSLAQPVITAGVSVITALVAVYVFREQMGFMNWSGLALICSGILLLFWGRA
jgi:multidrug transporter EmrE-like cation transporter